MELDNRIKEISKGLFYRYGIKSVTMDDIARELGISKKTIYQYYKDKDDIVCTIARTHIDDEEIEFKEVNQKAKDPIDELLQISVRIRRHFQMMHPSLLFDLNRFHPKAMKIFSDHREGCVVHSVRENIERGKELGLYRTDINTDIISILRIKEAELAFDADVFPIGKYDLSEVQGQIFDHFLYGIVSERGYKLLKKYKENITDEKNEKAA